MKIIGHIYTDMEDKFGVPRQSGLIPELKGRIVFEPEYRIREAFNGLSEYSHIWVIWQFSRSVREGFKPTVRPPRLGGNTHVGVFATRSPFRPNPIGLSCLALEGIDYDCDEGPVLEVSGVDMISGTPVYDIKPYLAYVDSHPEAVSGFGDKVKDKSLTVVIPDHFKKLIGDGNLAAVHGILSQDPRPGYAEDSDRMYYVKYSGMDIGFSVMSGVLTVVNVKFTMDSQ